MLKNLAAQASRKLRAGGGKRTGQVKRFGKSTACPARAQLRIALKKKGGPKTALPELNRMA
ncbi:hypothetical protein AJ87_10160 [Rhizobium yanglingense]|nr:hypothetical protein AJ87_10160 [Rhizobium yanglingense]